MTDELTEETNPSKDPVRNEKYAKKRLALSISFLTRRIDRPTFEKLRDALDAEPEFDMIAALESAGGTIHIDPREMTEAVETLVTEANPDLDDTARTLADLTEALTQLENALGAPTFKDPHAPDDHASTEAGIEPEGRTEFHGQFTISDRYQFIDVIKAGGQAVVCRARDIELNRVVAIKIPHAKGRSLESASRRIVVEARITGQLNHPAVIPIFALDKRADGRPFLILPYYPQGEFTNEIRQLHPGVETPWIDPMEIDLKLRGIVQSMVQLSRAIAFAHEHGIVHRDIKPGNILIGDHGEVFMADWGLAKNLRKSSNDQVQGFGGSSSPTDSHFAANDYTDRGGGTANFMSKEQALGEVDLQNEKTDIFLLGATLYSMIYGRAPFKDRTAAASYDVEFPRSPVRGIDWSLIGICKKAMAELQPDRYPTAADLATDLERWLADQPLLFVKEDRSKKIARFSRRHSRSIAAAALMLMAGTVGLLIMNDRIATARDNEAKALEDTRIALKNETIALENEKIAKQVEKAATKKATANADLAFQLSQTLYGIIAKKMPRVPGTESIRYEAARDLAAYYSKLMILNEYREDIVEQAINGEREAGNVGRFIGDFEVPLQHYLRALALLNRQLKNNPNNIKNMLNKGLLLRDLSLWYERIGNFAESEKRCDEGLKIVSEQRPLVKIPQFDELETILITRKSELFAALGRDEEQANFLDRLETSIDSWFGKYRQPKDQDFKISIGVKLLRADHLLRAEKFGEASEKFVKAFEEAKANENRDQDFRLFMGEARFGKARALQQLKDPNAVKQANQEIQEAFRTMDALRNDSPAVKLYAERVATISVEMLRFERLNEMKFDNTLDEETISKRIENMITEQDGPEIRSLRAQFLMEKAYRAANQANRQQFATKAATDLDYAIEKLPLRKDIRKERESIRSKFDL